MDFGESREREREDVFSKAVKAGKRTYFFDVKETKQGEKYLTITESKRKFNGDDGSFTYEKHKIFLYKEDYAKFQNALNGVINFIETGVEPVFEDDALNAVEEEFNAEIENIKFD
ncbi:MAG: DUF3276 family protein [Bacteroidales bacterium]|jgi:hypothetical protein|nr:DUF3276 family protein [Bacteroidales bacterium]